MSRGASSSGSCSATTSANFCGDTVLLSVGGGCAKLATELERHECQAAQEDEQVLEPRVPAGKEDGDGVVVGRQPEVGQKDEWAGFGVAAGIRATGSSAGEPVA